MSKYHISPTTGRPNICTAHKKPCPIGDADEHYGSKDEARTAYEAKMGTSVPTVQKKSGESVEALIDEYRSLLRVRTDESFERIRVLQNKLPDLMPPPPSPSAMMATIDTPKGFTRTESVWNASWGSQEAKYLPQLVFEGDGVKIEVNFSDDPNGYMLADGHVTFSSDKGLRSFDRHGVEDSFYIDNPRKNFSLEDPTRETNATIQDFIDRKIPESRARIAGSEKVPDLQGRLVTPEQKKELIDSGRLQLYPSGFGTGFHLSTARTSNDIGTREASEEQKRFFGVTNLWITEFDCD